MPRSARPQLPATLEAAEAIALQGLAFLAEEPGRLQRFVTVTGLTPEELRARADTPELLGAVLQHLAGDESLLLVFAAGRGIAPEAIAPAIALLEAHAP
jgi:Protein of unknown function (DUF3572)